jgi:predicted ATPase/DNA-binding winged helix-turn-helix (wHTH) protein
MEPASEASASVAFGRFRVLPHRRELLADGRPIKLGGRAFDVLMALIEARGAVVSKDALMRRVWPDRIVEENSLQAQIAALRAAFGAERELIRTVAGRGYQFIGEVRVLSAGQDDRADAGVVSAERVPPTNLPEAISELIGRDDELAEILNLAATHRLVTLTGTGGIGKTRLALAAARRRLPEFPEGVWLAEFSSLADPGLVSATVAAAVGIELGAGEVSAQRVAQALAGRRLLLVLDTCEHVIDAAAAMAEAVLRAGSAAGIIATSREPLRAEGERVYPVPPLPVPAAEGEDPWRYGAVLLFVVRSRASGTHVSEDRQLARVVAAICRRLDGIPLAIELAAARAAALGIEELAVRLDDRFHLLSGGRRTALPRHQTLRATLDWSCELLAEPERVILRRLAVFAGAFSLEAAGVVAASTEISASEVVECLSSLVAKSLIAAEVEPAVARYRLLDTTRAYALEKLSESGELERLARRHGEYYRDLFKRAETELDAQPTAEWPADYGRQIDNLRAALDWAFSPLGDPSIGVALTAAAVPLWTHLSLIDECRTRVECALGRCVAKRDGSHCEMKLYAARAASLMYARGPVPEASAVWAHALRIAEGLDDAEYQLRALWGLCVYRLYSGEYSAALELAQKFSDLAADKGDASIVLIGTRTIGTALHYLGDQPNARRHLEDVLAHYRAPARRSHVIRFQFDQRVTARVTLAQIMWIQGFPTQAMETAQGAVDEAQAAGHTLSLCNALSQAACPVGLYVGDLSAADRFVRMLLDHSAKHSLELWHVLGRCWNGVLQIRRGDSVGGLPLLRASLSALRQTRFALRYPAFCGVLAEALGGAGQAREALATIDGTLAEIERTGERWCLAEMLRLKGELVLLQAAERAAPTAKDLFRQALDWARWQGALSWELRAATSLARLLRERDRSADAMALLRPVYARFTEGFDTADLKAAQAVLDALPEHRVHLAHGV